MLSTVSRIALSIILIISSTVQYRFTIPFYAGAVGAHEITQPEEKLAKMKTLPKMSHHGSGGEAARLARYARARASGIAVAMRPP